MTPEQKVARMAGLTARIIGLVCSADLVLSQDRAAGAALLTEATILSREVRALRSPEADPPSDGAFPNLVITDGVQTTVLDASTVASILQSMSDRLALLENRMGSNGGPPLSDPPTPESA